MTHGEDTVLGRVKALLEQARDRYDESYHVVLTIPFSDMLMEAFLHAPLRGDRFCWIPAQTEASPANVDAVVGFGAAVRVTASGQNRFAEIKAIARESILQVGFLERDDTAVFHSLRFVGGASFFSSSCHDEKWRGFHAADFVLPRWSFFRTDGAGWLRLILTPEERADLQPVFQEADALDRWRSSGALSPSEVFPGAVMAESERERTDWDRQVAKALTDIDAGLFEKVVVSRVSDVTLEPGEFPMGKLLARLEKVSPGCHRFCVERGKSAFVGATPERLIRVSAGGHRVEADALAGSIARAQTGEVTDSAESQALLCSDKDRREFEYVQSFLCDRLSGLGGDIDPGEVRVRTLAHLHHLHASVEARFNDRAIHVLDVAAVIHPTPAVCGAPDDVAVLWLQANEIHDRGWYAGMVGWFDVDGDGELAVGIRSALISDGEARVFAGSGIVRGSVAKQEFAETQFKQAAMLAALGAR